MNALWIEDNRAEILPTLRRCSELGITVTLFSAVELALELLNAEAKWDLIVLDSYFPRPDGASHSGVLLFRELRNGKYGDWGRTVHIIFVTGFSDVVAGMLQAGPGSNGGSNTTGASVSSSVPPIAIVAKPANAEEVARLIQKFINDL